jgi:hypothetical protein
MINRILYFLFTSLCVGIILAGMILSYIGDIETGIQLVGVGSAGGILWYGLSKVLGD